jgi:pilus assembly protein CpaD
MSGQVRSEQVQSGPGLRARAVQLALVSLAALTLAGCSSLRPTQQAFAPDEYDQRHPIKIAPALEHIDIFATGRRLDRRQRSDIVDFGRDYAQNGRGEINAAVPGSAAGMHMMADIRAALGESGARAPLRITQYQPDPRLGAAPVRLSFVKLKAEVASKCGLWPADLAGSKDAETWHNRPYHNFGCAYQTMIAAQVADPIDLIRPRAEGQADTVKRTKDIEALRKDQDPSTKWAKDDVKIKEAQQ